MDWLFDFSCHGGPGAIHSPYGDDQETGRRGSCIYFCHNMCLVVLKVVATMRLVVLKGFPNLHKLAAFKTTWMQWQVRIASDGLTSSRLALGQQWRKASSVTKKESRAAFETVLQQANWQRWKTPTRGIEPLVIWHDDMVCRLTRMIFTYQARGFRGWMSFHHPRCPACFSGISRVCSLNINAESSTKLKPSAALLSLQWRRRTIYRCLKFLLELCLGSVFDSKHTISLILTWCWFIRSWRLFHHLSQVDPHCILFCGPIRSAWRGLAKRLVGCSRGSWSVVRNWIT